VTITSLVGELIARADRIFGRHKDDGGRGSKGRQMAQMVADVLVGVLEQIGV